MNRPCGVLIVALGLLAFLPRTLSMNVDEGINRLLGSRQRFGALTSSGSLTSSRPIDPSQGRRRQTNPRRRQLLPRIRDNISKERINELTSLFKANVDRLRRQNQLDLIFIIDESSSVGLTNFLDEIKFVSRFVSGIEVDMNHTRVAVVTFADNVTSWVNQVSLGEIHAHKCSLLGQDLPSIVYVGGGTFTKGALEETEIILENAREDSKKVIFLITDGDSNGGDPRPMATTLQRKGVEIFTFGIKDGNREELTEIASEPKEGHRLILNSFKEFEMLARRALHTDLESGNYIVEDSSHCDRFCTETACCQGDLADCRCGTMTGHYECVCKPGYYGSGLRQDGCQACPEGTYKHNAAPGDEKSCIPCPDERMNSPEAATSLDQCTCPEGFKKEDDRCEHLMCMGLFPPENGRFLVCDGKYKSTCTAACNSGYDLQGTETIICGKDEHWTALDGTERQEAFCQIRYCEAIEAPENGIMECSNDDYSYSTVCDFECSEGYRLHGTASRMCDAHQHWTGAEVTCIEITCPVIRQPLHGVLSSGCTTLERPKYGDECSFSCPHEGFKLLVASTVTCSGTGNWDPPIAVNEMRICNDTSPPEITCPPDMTVSTAARKAYAEVTWEPAKAFDNSETATVTPSWTFPVSLRIGEHTMTYTATDESGLATQCQFTVTVEDNEPPMIDRCRGPQPFIIERGEGEAEDVEWTVPTFSDNSESLTVSGNGTFGTFPIGTTVVEYLATDAAGNARSCVIDISVQDNTCRPRLENPRHGHIDCEIVGEATDCEMICDTEWYGFAMISYGNPLYTCQRNGRTWIPSRSIPSSISMDCSKQKFSSEILKDIQVTYDMATLTRCNDTKFIADVRQTFIYIFKPKIPELCVRQVGGHLTCSLVDVSVKCVGIVEQTDDTDDGYGYGDYGDGYDYAGYEDGEEEAKRRKRSTDSKPKTRRLKRIKLEREHLRRFRRQAGGQGAESIPEYESDEYYDEDSSEAYTNEEGEIFEEIGDDYGDGDYGGDSIPTNTLQDADSIGGLDPDVNVNFEGDLIPQEEITELIDNVIPDVIPPEYMTMNGNEVTRDRLEITITIRGEVVLDGVTIEGDRIRHTNMVEFIHNMNLEKGFGTIARQIDVNVANSTVGDYVVYADNTYGQTDELICPIGTVLRNKASCVNCPVGTYYDVITANCKSCPIEYYQDHEAQLSCQPCPAGTGTLRIHSRDLSDCKNLCEPGFYEEKHGMGICSACPQGTFADFYGANICARCPDGEGTIGVGADSLEDCGVLCKPDFVSATGLAPCQPCPAGTIQEQPGKTFCYVCGENQALAMDDFVVCSDIAPQEMEELDALYYNECFAKPCKNNATCSGQGSTFTCKCKPGFTGTLCQTEINECEPTPCAETATCVDLINGFRCECSPGYTGQYCGLEIDECATMLCQNEASCVDLHNAFSCDCATGYTGDLCEIDIDDCADNPCQNGGTCVDEVAGFHCECATGFQGAMCQTNIDDCNPDPCLNGATCIDEVNNFRCECKPGYLGVLCDEDINECVSDPCVNGQCLDLVNSYKCLCPPTYLGEHCDEVGDPYFDLYFGKPNTYHHVKLGYALPNMTEVTVSFYLHSNVTKTYGTPFSYAVGDGKLADTLTLTDLSALTLYVNGEFVVSDSRPINDGSWYLVTVVWTSEEGRWFIYLNGQLEDSGEGLATGQSIPGGGVLVIGQEQDSLGGDFSASQEFLGTISQFNIYDRAFTPNDILKLFRNCAANIGSVRAWPEIGGGIIGNIERNPTEFCLPCPSIESDEGTVVQVEDDVTIELACNKGHRLLFPVKQRMRTFTFRCGSDAVWKFFGRDVAAELMKCGKVSCPELKEITLGTLSVTGTKYGDIATYSCIDGYEVVGTRERKCRSNERWSGRIPKCRDVDECSSDSACHRKANCTNSVGSYDCACVYGWKGDGHECQEIDCGGAGSLQFGSISGNNFKLGGIVHYSCDYGYRLEGPTQRTCLFNDSWSGEMPTCVKVECPEPENVRHSRKHPEIATRSYKSEIEYTCHPGYYMIGNATRECGPDSRWTGTLPSCERVSCDDPPIVANAVIIKDGGIKYGDIVHYICEREYKPLGDSELRCNASRMWEAPNNQHPVCEHPTCNVPRSIINGEYGISKVGESTVTDAVYTYATEVEYVCNVGYNLVGATILTCIEREAWDKSVPRCDIVSCGPPPVVENAHQEHNGELYGDLANYMCKSGYLMEGETALTCLASGKWTDENQINPSCNPRPCEKPLNIAHSRQILTGAEGHVYKAVVKFQCDLGYWASGNHEISCNTDGQWTPEQNFRCDIAVCSDPISPHHGTFTRLEPEDGFAYEYNNTVSFSCDAGFYSLGWSNSRCTEDGVWSHPAPVCLPVECTLPDIVANATFEVLNGPYGEGPVYESHILHTCDNGYEQSAGEMRRKCTEDGTWTGESPVCSRVYCGGAPTVQFATHVLNLYDPEAVGQNLFYLDKVEYLCNVGFYLEGESVVQCTEYMDFTALPTCLPVSCGEPPVVQYSTFTQVHVYGENVYQSTTTYACEQDFRITGSSVSMCSEDGEWVFDDTAVCEPITCEEPDAVINALQFVSASEDDVAHPDIYKSGKYQPRSAAITACEKGYEIREVVASLMSSEVTTDKELARDITTKSIDKLALPKQERIRKILSKFLDEEPRLAALVAAGPQRISAVAPKTLFIRQCSEAVGWLKAAPKCQPMLCSVPFELENGHLVKGDAADERPSFGTGIQYACDVGYKFADSESIEDVRTSECNWSDDLWNVYLTPIPECLPLPCPLPPTIHHGSFSEPDGENFVFKDVATYSCDEGFEMTSGEPTMRCQSAQIWNTEPPTCSPVKCPEPSPPTNGKVRGRSWIYESVISFSCDRGYNLNGTANLTCQADRSWSDAYPKCDPVPCGPPQEVPNSNVLATSEVYQGCAIYTCKHGFYLNGYAKLKCTAAGTWQKNLPTCEFMLCPKPPVTSHVIFADSVLSELFSDRDSGNYIYDDIVTYSCEEGYETDDVDDLSAMCLTGENIPFIPSCEDIYYIEDVIDGYWSRPPPVCTAKDCGSPPAAHENGIVIGTETTFNNTVQYRCKNGYYTNDVDQSATCLSNAKWSRLESPECFPVSCGEPDTPQNGYFNGSVFTFQEVITFGCDAGHNLVGPKTIRCQATATWSDESPVCEPKDCGELPLVKHGKLSFEDTIFGEEAIYTCNSGYYLKGRSLFECVATGRWSHPTPPRCLPVDCGALKKPTNGRLNATGHVFMNRAVYSCLSGYNLVGVSESECLASATWSSQPPVCEPVDCKDPPPLENAQITITINGSTTFTSLHKYFCDSGYEMTGTGIASCRADATWSESPVCTRVKCSGPGRPQNGEMSFGAKLDYVYEDVVEFSCNQGYYSVGETTATCTTERTWSNALPQCQPVDCGDLPYVAHGRKSGWQKIFMTVINYSCWPGFYIAGNSSLECLHTGQWSSEPPSCERVSCGRPPHLKYGSVTGADGPDDWVYEAHVLFSCNTGYHLHGGSGAECDEDGEWIFDFNFYDEDSENYEDKTEAPVCVIIQCPEPPTIEHGSFAVKNYTYNHVVTYTCDEGHEKDSDGDLKCTGEDTTSQGHYIGEPPKCNPISCGEPKTIDNADVMNDGIIYESLAVYTCEQGHNLIGDPAAECQANKRWSSVPRCEPKNCGLPELPEFSNITIPSTLFPAVLEVLCEDGYDLQGEHTMQCTSEGVWSNQDSFECTPVVCGDPHPVENGIFSFSGIVFRNQAVYQCHPGYNLVSQGTAPIDATVTLKCQADGTWQDGLPRCDPVECGLPPTTEYGYSDQDENIVVFPQSVNYDCNYGYSFGWFATTTIECTASGEFSGSAPRCYPVSCGAPPSRQNAMVDAEAYTFLNVATFTCKFGYVIEMEENMFESFNSQCTGEGLWVPLPPVEGCVPYDCGPPLILPNAEVPAYTRNSTFGDLYSYTCVEGHEAPDDTLTVNCQQYGEWSVGPNCQPVDCGTKHCPDYALCQGIGTNFGSTVSANCNEGYEFKPGISSYEVRCTAAAVWNEPEGIENPDECVRLSCGPPPVVANSRSVTDVASGEAELYGSEIRYTCDPGHDQEGTDTMECLADGTWGPDLPPTCVPKDCGDPPPCIDKANCTVETTTFKSFISVSCNEGFELERDVPIGNLRCTESGEWEQPIPEVFACLPLECLSLPTIKHGRPQREKEGKNPTFQDKVGYECHEGYYVEGVLEVTCQSDRTYTEVPECLPVSCGSPSQLENGQIETTGETYQNQASYQCEPGYYMEGARDWICSAEGKWVAERIAKSSDIPTSRMAAPPAYSTIQLQVMLSESSGQSPEATSEMLGGSGDHSDEAPSGKSLPVPSALASPLELFPEPVRKLDLPPTCHPVSCGIPPKVANTNEIFTESLVFKESVTYRCRPGFEMIGEAVLDCQSTGRFGPNPPPTCVRVQCSIPDVTENCELIGTAPFKFEDTLIYRPLKGYEFSAGSAPPLFMTCMADGQSNVTDLPNCVPVSCEIPHTPLNGRILAEGFTYQQTVTYSCLPGYELDGPSVITCLSSRGWSSEAPGCRPVSCGTPPFLTLGSMKLASGNVDPFTYGQSVEYTCDLGYQFDSEEAGETVKILCQYDREWDSAPPQCVPVPCPELPEITNGEFNMSGEAVFRAKAYYKCDVGYEMEGEPLLICQADGIWSSDPPVCSPVSCDLPPRVPYSSQPADRELVYGESVTYECIPGYQPHGAMRLTCSENKMFDFPAPVCFPIECERPEELEFGHYLKNVGGFLFMSSITYRCSNGYRMTSEDEDSQHKTVTCEANKQWSGGAPECEIVTCEDPSPLENGYVDYSSTTYRSMIAYSCDSGFLINKNSSHFEHCLDDYVCMICQANGIWGNGNSETAPANPTCSPVSCGEPPVLENSSSESDSLAYKGATTYTCDRGYEFPSGDDFTLECWSTAQWGPLPLPSCQKVKCSNPIEIDHGYLNVVEKFTAETQEYVFGDVITYTCESGYEETAIENLTCGADSIWDSEPPACIPVNCGPAPTRKHGYLVGSDDVRTTYQSVISYHCDVGYEYIGDQSDNELTCTAEGVWSSAEPPPCTPVDCGLPIEVLHGSYTLDEEQTIFRSEVDYVCNIGHEMSGDGTLVCHSDELWKPSPPTCHPVSCSVPPTIDHGEPDLDSEPVTERAFPSDPGTPEKRDRASAYGYIYQDTVKYLCDVGYTIEEGPTSAVCNENGVWSDLPTCALVTCDALPAGDNSMRNGEATVYDSVISYVCDEGYTLGGNETTISCTCGQHGYFIPVSQEHEEEWCRDTLPECTEVSCGAPPTVPNSVSDNAREEYFYGDEIAFACSEGYEMTGEPILRCNANRRYNHPAPQCTRITCGLPQAVENAATLVTEGIRFGDAVTYECHPGYVLMSESNQRFCQADGLWSDECVRCDPVNCTEIEPPLFGSTLMAHNVTFGSVVIFGCDEGNGLVGRGMIMCEATGNWSSSVPDCIPIPCDPLPVVEYGIPLTDLVVPRFGDVVEFMCIEGYELRDSAEISCLSSGAWTEPPTCDPVKCLEVPEIPNSVVENAKLDPFTYGQVVQYACNAGYELRTSQRTLTCQADGTFSADLDVICQRISCPPAPSIDHGGPSTEMGVYGDWITYSCDEGYEIFGSDSIRCGILGSWFGPRPSCEPVVCGPAPTVEHAFVSIEQEDYIYQDVATYECEEGHEFGSEARTASCQADGNFLIADVRCSPVTCDVIPTTRLESLDDENAINNTYSSRLFWTVFYETEALTYLSEATLTCEPGFVLESGKDEERFICQANKTWSGKFSNIKCISIECPKLPALSNGDIEITHSPERVRAARTHDLTDDGHVHVFGARASFQCHEGYTLQGASTVICGEEGRWSSLPPTCAPVECGKAPALENALLIESFFTYGMIVEYVCEEGFYLASEAKYRTCQTDGSFSDEEVTCALVLCPYIPPTDFGVPKLNESRVGDENEYICQPGFESHSVVRCSSSGEWSGALEPCIPVECDLPPDIQYARLIGSRDYFYMFGESAIYTCHEGHVLGDGSDGFELACQTDGSFIAPENGCMPVECNLGQEFENARLHLDQEKAVFGDVAELICNDGYEGTGSQQVYCTETGEWNFEEAGCQIIQCGVAPTIENARPVLAADYVYTYSSTVKYTCLEGYELIDLESLITCQSDGTFTDLVTDMCAPMQCTVPEEIEFGTVSTEVASHGEELVVTCDIGYEVDGYGLEEITLVCETGGVWSLDINSIACVPITCDPLESLEHGMIFLWEPILKDESDTSTLLFDSTILYQCNTGYTLKGVAKQNCLPDGSWSGILPRCIPVECGTPPFILHGTITGGEQSTFGNEISYVCNEGYSLDPPESLTRSCNEMGLWTGQHPVCTIVNCGDPATVENAEIDSYAFTYESEFNVICNEGYRMTSGDAMRACQADGTWSGDNPICEQISCGVHPPVENGIVEPENASFIGDEVQIKCKGGFDLFGNAFRACENEGVWGGVEPQCIERIAKAFGIPELLVLRTCGPPVINGSKVKLVEGTEEKKAYDEGDKLEYCCSPGYVPSGKMVIQCAGGAWSGQPSCIPQCRHKCRNRGRCAGNNRCTCAHGWEGSRCHKPVCTLPCLNGGFCSGPFLCTCKPGWTGTRCQTPVCTKTCQNGGRCVNPDSCYCPYGYGGVDCSENSYFSLW